MRRFLYAVSYTHLAGIKRYVMVSYLGAGSGHGIDPDDSFYAYAESKTIADEHLRGSGLDYTILGPGTLTLEEAGGITLGKMCIRDRH